MKAVTVWWKTINSLKFIFTCLHKWLDICSFCWILADFYLFSRKAVQTHEQISLGFYIYMFQLSFIFILSLFFFGETLFPFEKKFTWMLMWLWAFFLEFGRTFSKNKKNLWTFSEVLRMWMSVHNFIFFCSSFFFLTCRWHNDYWQGKCNQQSKFRFCLRILVRFYVNFFDWF